MQKVSVLLPTNNDDTYYYYVSKDMQVSLGTFVKVPFRNKIMLGIVWYDGDDKVDPKKIKKVIEILPIEDLTRNLIDFLNFFHRYNVVAIGKILRLVLPQDYLLQLPKRSLKRFQTTNDIKSKDTHLDLTSDQKKSASSIIKSIKEGKFSRFLIDGVTGSGKTEIYFEAINEVLKQGKQSLVLLPEIALTNVLVSRIEDRFGSKPGIWHSSMKASERSNIWKEIANGNAKLVVGARSALFLPFKDLGLIVVDEEHDASYKQTEKVIYNARDMAISRASFEKITVILASATPSLETLLNAKEGKYTRLRIKERVGPAILPEVSTIDMRQENIDKGRWISPTLQKRIIQTLENGEQVLLFLNRRGYAPLTLCRKCGHRIDCRKCDSFLVHHKEKNTLLCHQCGFSDSYKDFCYSCKAKNSFIPYGPGIERINEEVKDIFPEANVALLSSDNVKESNVILEQVYKGSIDIIIGTQIISKGHHFPNLTLVGILDADLGFLSSDLRASERTFQLLHQVSGRSGREEKLGSAMIQTYFHDHPVIKSLCKNDRKGFTEVELKIRKRSLLPPYGRLASIIVSSKDEGKVQEFCKKLKSLIPSSKNIRVLGPAPSPIMRIRNRVRYRFLIKAAKNSDIQRFIKEWIGKTKIPNSMRVIIDVDPYDFL